jgi:hypothetical protein
VIDEAKVDAARLGTFSRSPRSIEPRHIRRGAKRLAILADPNATAATNDCWQFGFARSGRPRWDADRQVAIPPRPQKRILPCSGLRK